MMKNSHRLLVHTPDQAENEFNGCVLHVSPVDADGNRSLRDDDSTNMMGNGDR